MPAGLQIWDESGNLIVDITTRLTRILGSQVISPGSSGVITHPDFANGDIWFMARAGANDNLAAYMPYFSIDNVAHTLSYEPMNFQNPTGGTGAQQTVTVFYGVY